MMLNNEKKTPLWASSDRGGKTEQKNAPLGELLFFLAFFLFCLKYTLDYSNIIPMRPEVLNSLCVALSITCSGIKIFMQRYTPLRFALTMAVCLIMGYSSLISTNYAFLLGFLLIVAMQDIDFAKVVRFGFFFKIISLAVHVSWYIFIFNTNPAVIRFNFRGATGVGMPRHNFFMGHSNNFMAFLIWACMEYIYMRYDKLNIFHMAVIWALNIIFFMFTDSQTAILVLILVTFFILADKLGKGFFDKLLSSVAKYSYTFISLFFLFLIVIYPETSGRAREIWDDFDWFLSGRIWYGAYAYYVYGLTFLGIPDMQPQKVFWENRWNDTLTIFDNYYIGNLVSYGFVNTILTVIVFIAFCGKMENREKIIIIAFTFYGIMESYVTNVVICFALFIIGKYLYEAKPIKSAGKSL